jgi:nitrogen fixation protein
MGGIREMTLRATLKPRKCRVCETVFVRQRSTQFACSNDCAAAWARKVAEKKQAREKQIERRTMRERIEKAKTRADHLKEAQAAVNAYVRLRDANDPCISCDRPATWGGQWHGSHYRAVGSNPGWRFNLLNIHRACSICNAWKSGNLTEYRPRLIAKIGLANVEMLEQESPVRKFDIEYLKRLKTIFRKKARRLERRIEQRREAA